MIKEITEEHTDRTRMPLFPVRPAMLAAAITDSLSACVKSDPMQTRLRCR